MTGYEFLTKDDKGTFQKFMAHWFEQMVNQQKGPDALYHYTSGHGLLGIIERKNIWATAIQFLNDSKEFTACLGIMDELLTDRLSKKDSVVLKILQEHIRSEMASKSPELLNIENVSNHFVACFSTKRDKLSQWRGYGGQHSGYAVKFDISKLHKLSKSFGGLLAPCIYKKQMQHDFSVDLFNWIEKIYTDSMGRGLMRPAVTVAEQCVREVSSHLLWILPMLKDEGFDEEHEWRILVLRSGADIGDLKFRVKDRAIIPYIELDLTQGQDDGKAPITEVMVGPTGEKDLSALAVWAALQKLKMPEILVSKSTIPFRIL